MRRRLGLPVRLAAAFPHYAGLAWWGLFWGRFRAGRSPWIAQAVILSEGRVVLAVRRNLRGWELPGGHGSQGESLEETVVREVREETGLAVVVERHVGDYHRSGFAAHAARVFVCRVVGGALAPSVETPRLAWFPLDRLPRTLFPWYRQPLADAAAGSRAVVRREHQGIRAILAGMAIDLRMRWSDDRAG